MNPEYMPADPAGRLFWLLEELGELVAALGKTGRFGPDSYNPELPPNQRERNCDWVLREMEDVRAAMDGVRLDMLARSAMLRARSTSEGGG